MREIKGDLWKFHDEGHWVCVTTNGVVKPNGELVMGKGVALEAAKRAPELPAWAGAIVESYGNHAFAYPEKRMILFPTKYNWRDNSDIELIRRSAWELSHMAFVPQVEVYLPRCGCGNGGLNWEKDVRPVMEGLLYSQRFTVVSV